MDLLQAKVLNSTSLLSTPALIFTQKKKSLQELELLFKKPKLISHAELIFHCIRLLNNYDQSEMGNFLIDTEKIITLLYENFGPNSKDHHLIWTKYLNVANKFRSIFTTYLISSNKIKAFHTDIANRYKVLPTEGSNIDWKILRKIFFLIS